MNIFEYISSHPGMTIFMVLIMAILVEEGFKYCINRPLRHMNIRKHGWPPAHCDADGDFKKEDKE